MAPLLASGSTGVFKPPELTPFSSLRMAQIWESIEGVVPGVINMVPGIGAEAGEALVDHPNVTSIHFTGSCEIGQRIQSRAANTMKRCFLELGGKNPFIVFDDANIDKAAMVGCMASTATTGQFCGSPTRMLIHQKVHDQFVEKLSKHYESQKYGRWDEEGVYGGPLISQKQLDRNLMYIQSGKDQGATVVTGGNRIDREGYFLRPTLMINCRDDMKMVQEEIFGPVVAVQKFSDIDEVIQRANGVKYGLVGAVFSEDQRKCHKVSRGLQAGLITVNSYF